MTFKYDNLFYCCKGGKFGHWVRHEDADIRDGTPYCPVHIGNRVRVRRRHTPANECSRRTNWHRKLFAKVKVKVKA